MRSLRQHATATRNTKYLAWAAAGVLLLVLSLSIRRNAEVMEVETAVAAGRDADATGEEESLTRSESMNDRKQPQRREKTKTKKRAVDHEEEPVEQVTVTSSDEGDDESARDETEIENDGETEEKRTSRKPKPRMENAEEESSPDEPRLEFTEHIPPLATKKKSHDPYNVYFLKIPKVGGTTIAVMLQRYAKEYGLKIGSPLPETRSLNTCRNKEEALKSWGEMRSRAGGKFDIFASHGCFKPFMLQPAAGWTQPSRLLKLTMFREPWSRLMSFYRYVLKCCETKPYPLEWCREQCGWARTPSQFLQHNCNSLHSNCNQLHYYVRSQYPNEMMTPESAEKALESFDVVLTLESLDEGLVLLHMEYGLPFEMLPVMNANANAKIPVPKIAEGMKTRILREYMQPDVALYEAAVARLKSRVETGYPLGTPAREEFDAKVKELRRLRKAIDTKCATRFGDCLTRDLGLVSEASCYWRCVESVVRGEEPGPVPYCGENDAEEEETEAAAQCSSTGGNYKKYCSFCKCRPDGGAECRRFTFDVKRCLKLDVARKCVPKETVDRAWGIGTEGSANGDDSKYVK